MKLCSCIFGDVLSCGVVDLLSRGYVYVWSC